MNICLVSANDVMEHFAFPGNIDFSADDHFSCIIHVLFMFIIHVLFILFHIIHVVSIHCLWNNVYHRWIKNSFPFKWHRTASTASACKSSPRKIFHWNSSGERRVKFIGERIKEDNREAEGTSLSTAKATSPTQRPQTSTESATKYYNYIVNETDEQREHGQPTPPKTTRLDQATLKVYSQNYLLRYSDTQQELCTSWISFQRTRDSRSAFTPLATMGFTVSFISQWTVFNTQNVWHVKKRYICKQSPY